MSFYKETAMAVPALALLLFVSHTVFGPDESFRRLTTTPRSWLGGSEIPAERFIAKHLIAASASYAGQDPASFRQTDVGYLTPEARIRTVFAQFEPRGPRRAT